MWPRAADAHERLGAIAAAHLRRDGKEANSPSPALPGFLGITYN